MWAACWRINLCEICAEIYDDDFADREDVEACVACLISNVEEVIS